MTILFQPISALAAAPVAALHRSCFPEDPWDAGTIRQIVGIAGFFGRIATIEDEAVGFALALDLVNECEILSLGVLPERRRVGAGRALLREICGEARRRRAEFAVLEVAVDNLPARSLYAALGFSAVGSRQKYYRRGASFMDALILRLSLAGTSLAV